MKKSILCCAVLALAASTPSRGDVTVVPIGLANTEGTSSSSSFFQNNPASVQAYFSEAFLNAAGITPGATIDGIAYRRQGGGTTGPATDISFASYNIFMSDSFADPASFTNTFASNVVGPQTQVYGGSLSFAANSFPGGSTPNAFGPLIDFTTPYAYDGGSLLVEVRRGARTGAAAFNTDTDGTNSQGGARWLFNTSSDTATTGTIVVGAQIFQLEFTPIPEPSSLALIAAGAACLARRRRRHHARADVGE